MRLIGTRLCSAILITMVLSFVLSANVFAKEPANDSNNSTTQANSVAGAVESTWNEAAGQIKTVVNKVVFPAGDLILAVFFFVKLGMCYFDYRKHGQFDWAPPAILFISLVFMMTAPLYIWGILGI